MVCSDLSHLSADNATFVYTLSGLIASFPGLLHLKFLIALQVIKNWRCRRPGNEARRRPGAFLHMIRGTIQRDACSVLKSNEAAAVCGCGTFHFNPPDLRVQATRGTAVQVDQSAQGMAAPVVPRRPAAGCATLLHRELRESA